MKLIKGTGQLLSSPLLLLSMACGEELVERIDPDVQLQEDIAIIENYLEDNGYTDYDTLSSETRLVVLTLGSGDMIDYGDIVTMDYAGLFTNDSVFDTSVDSLTIIRDDLGVPQDTLNVSPDITTTHTPGGWYFNQTGFISGFKDGVNGTLEQVRVNGTALMLIPSQAAYGTLGQGSIAPNTVLLFKVTPKISR